MCQVTTLILTCEKLDVMGIIVIAVVALLVLFFIGRKTKINIPEIHKCNTLSEIVMLINHGRVYPYFTGMSLKQVKRIVKRSYGDTNALDRALQMHELTGYIPSIDLPDSPSEVIDRISIGFNRGKVVSSISIDIKNFNANKTELIKLMAMKFGRPMSMDDMFIIWRDGCMVVNIHKEGSLNIIDERFFR